MENKLTPIEKEVEIAMAKWYNATEKILREIISRKGVPGDQISVRCLVKYLENNVKEYYIDEELVLTTKIVTEKSKIKFEIIPAKEDPLPQDANREMIGDDADHDLGDIGNK